MATTVFDDIRRVVEAYLAANWTDTSIQFENTALAVEGLTAYIAPAIRFSDVRRDTLTGSPLTGQRQIGILAFQIFVRPGTGTGAAYDYADKLRDLFNEISIVITATNNVRFDAARISHAAPTDDWWQLNVEIPFEHFDS